MGLNGDSTSNSNKRRILCHLAKYDIVVMGIMDISSPYPWVVLGKDLGTGTTGAE